MTGRLPGKPAGIDINLRKQGSEEGYRYVTYLKRFSTTVNVQRSFSVTVKSHVPVVFPQEYTVLHCDKLERIDYEILYHLDSLFRIPQTQQQTATL